MYASSQCHQRHKYTHRNAKRGTEPLLHAAFTEVCIPPHRSPRPQDLPLTYRFGYLEGGGVTLGPSPSTLTLLSAPRLTPSLDDVRLPNLGSTLGVHVAFVAFAADVLGAEGSVGLTSPTAGARVALDQAGACATGTPSQVDAAVNGTLAVVQPLLRYRAAAGDANRVMAALQVPSVANLSLAECNATKCACPVVATSRMRFPCSVACSFAFRLTQALSDRASMLMALLRSFSLPGRWAHSVIGRASGTAPFLQLSRALQWPWSMHSLPCKLQRSNQRWLPHSVCVRPGLCWPGLQPDAGERAWAYCMHTCTLVPWKACLSRLCMDSQQLGRLGAMAMC
jgi:hypothetical protein